MKDIETQINDPRICASLRTLVKIKLQSNGFTFLPKHIATSKLAGRHGSKFRGRGINFEELRAYNIGDDIRTIDWRVTLKTGSPHIRSYSEEKDHNVIVCVDQTQSMFFSSVETMKSVVAAEIAALCAWRVLADNDRIGGFIMSDSHSQWFSPKRGEKPTMAMLGLVEKVNRNLLTQEMQYDSEQDLKIEKAVDGLLKKGVKNSVIILISDFYNLTSKAIDKLKILQAHNDVLCIQILDKMEKNWKSNDLIFSDGYLQLNVDEKEEEISEFLDKNYKDTKESLSKILSKTKIPLIELDTSGKHIRHFLEQLSGVSNVGR